MVDICSRRSIDQIASFLSIFYFRDAASDLDSFSHSLKLGKQPDESPATGRPGTEVSRSQEA